MIPPDFKNEPGWRGAFTRSQAEGAIPNGARIVKHNSEPGDANLDGTPGIVLGSFRAPPDMGNIICYFIEWAAAPRVAVGTLQHKIREAA